MTIRMKLLLSYIGMILIPLLLFFPMALLLNGIYAREIQEVIGFDQGTSDGSLFPAVKETFEKRSELFAGIKFMARYDPHRLMDREFLKDIDGEFNQLKSGLVVMKQDRVAYLSPFLEGVDLSRIPEWIEGEHHDHDLHFEGNDHNFKVEKYDFLFRDRTPGVVYLFTDTSSLHQFFKSFFPLLVLSIVTVIGFTNALLTYLVSRGIIKPLYALKRAAQHIAAGNLDHEVNVNRKDEIGDLGEAFEEMRCRLKESIHLQLQYEENRKELISNISHDLKTPITGIKGCVEGILDGIVDTKEKQVKYMRMIYKKATDMDRMIDELLLFSKLDLKRLPFHFERIDIVAYLYDCVEDFRHDPQKQGIHISFPYTGDHPVHVMADREKLSRVMMNIVDNSIKYARDQDIKIRLELFVKEEEITIKIEDNGPGIEQEALPFIFDRFYRVEPSRSTTDGGSGLGLAIVKQIVEAHGGVAWAECKAGEGTSIFFTLPKTNVSSR